jgi:hypothetical protein
MSVNDCSAVRRLLSAFHDGELTIDERVAVQGHLHGCARCAGEAQVLREMGEVLRMEAAARIEAVNEDLAGLSASVISRLGAERSESLSGRAGRLFEDFHVVWAALGATGAAAACVAAFVGMVYFFTPPGRPDSLAAVFAAWAAPGSNENPVSISPRMALPSSSADDALSSKLGDADAEEDLVVLMDLLVSKEGQVMSGRVLNADDETARAETAARQEAIREVSKAILNARLRPAYSMSGAPLAVNVVWLHAHMTVRGKVPTELRTPGRALSMLLPAESNPLVAA